MRGFVFPGVAFSTNTIFVYGLNGLFHASDLFIRQKIKLVRAFSCGESPIVLQTKANEQIDLH